MVMYVLLMVLFNKKVVLRYVLMEYGVLSVKMASILLMPMYFVLNWAMMDHVRGERNN